MIKNLFVPLMLFIALAFVTACSSDEEQESGFKYNPTSEVSQVSWITPNSATIKAGKRSIVLLSSEKPVLEDVEKAYNMSMTSSAKTVVWSEFDDADYINGQLFSGLTPSTTYYYVTLVYNNVDEYFSYGDIGSFTTDEPIEEIVDLGLSVKWRGWNLGAETPYNRGDGYMWGNTTIGYFTNPTYPQEANIVGTEYDAARVKLGNSWRMPTKQECEELSEKCTFQKVSCYDETHNLSWEGVYVTGPSGKHIFIPMTWTLTVNNYYELDYFNTCCFWIGESNVSNGDRYYYSGYMSGSLESSFGAIRNCYNNWALPIRAVME